MIPDTSDSSGDPIQRIQSGWFKPGTFSGDPNRMNGLTMEFTVWIFQISERILINRQIPELLRQRQLGDEQRRDRQLLATNAWSSLWISGRMISAIDFLGDSLHVFSLPEDLSTRPLCKTFLYLGQTLHQSLVTRPPPAPGSSSPDIEIIDVHSKAFKAK